MPSRPRTWRLQRTFGLVVALIAGGANLGCSGGCNEGARTRMFKSADYRNWLHRGKSTCDLGQTRPGLSAAQERCPSGPDAKEYLLACDITFRPAKGDRLDEVAWTRYDEARDECIYETRGVSCME